LGSTLVIVPARNEAECVAEVVRYWRDQGAAKVRVVDNGSTDNTATLAREAGAEVMYGPRRGYGAAAWRGIQNIPPGVEWVLFCSADGSDQLDPTSAAAFQSAIEAGADLVLGERVSLPDSRRHLRGVQQFGNWLCCRLLWLGWGSRFRNMASLRLLCRGVITRLRLKDRDFGWNVEMQIRAVEEGLRIVEVPVTYHPRLAGTPKISGNPFGVVRAAWGMIGIIVRLYWRNRCYHHIRRPTPVNPREF